jgi:hypothetical protein
MNDKVPNKILNKNLNGNDQEQDQNQNGNNGEREILYVKMWEETEEGDLWGDRDEDPHAMEIHKKDMKKREYVTK